MEIWQNSLKINDAKTSALFCKYPHNERWDLNAVAVLVPKFPLDGWQFTTSQKRAGLARMVKAIIMSF